MSTYSSILNQKINDFHDDETFASLPEELQGEFKTTMAALLNKIEAAKPDCTAPARVLERFLEHLEPARASSFNPTRSMNSYNSYQQLVAMKLVEPVANFKDLSLEQKLEYNDMLVRIEERTPLYYRQRELGKLYSKMTTALVICDKLGVNAVFLAVPRNKDDHTKLAKVLYNKPHGKRFVKHLQRKLGHKKLTMVQYFQAFCKDQSAFDVVGSNLRLDVPGGSSTSRVVEAEAPRRMTARDRGRESLVKLFEKAADDEHVGKGRVPWHLIKVGSTSPMKITKKKTKAQYCLHGWKRSWALPNESRAWQKRSIDAFQRAILEDKLYITRLDQNSSATTGNATTTRSPTTYKKRSRRRH